jgi:hypothetical protein
MQEILSLAEELLASDKWLFSGEKLGSLLACSLRQLARG